MKNDNQIERVSISKLPVDVHGIISHTGEERTEFVVYAC